LLLLRASSERSQEWVCYLWRLNARRFGVEELRAASLFVFV
jgi:hypothetical protein